MWDCFQQPASGPSYQEFLKVLEADIQHANVLAVPRGKGGACFHLKLAYDHLAPIFLFLLKWIDCSCTCLLSSYLNLFHIVVYKVRTDGKQNLSSFGRKATIGEFYSVILPSLHCLHNDSLDLKTTGGEFHGLGMAVRKISDDKWKKLSDVDLEREDDVVDTHTLLKEDILRFHLFINSLPMDIPDTLFLMYYEFLF